jgi:predicted nucleic acid-binding protein
MPLLQVRNCPEDIYKKIAFTAKKENRTIAQQVISLLEKGLQMEEPNIERRRALLEKIDKREIKKEVDLLDDLFYAVLARRNDAALVSNDKTLVSIAKNMLLLRTVLKPNGWMLFAAFHPCRNASLFLIEIIFPSINITRWLLLYDTCYYIRSRTRQYMLISLLIAERTMDGCSGSYE